MTFGAHGEGEKWGHLVMIEVNECEVWVVLDSRCEKNVQHKRFASDSSTSSCNWSFLFIEVLVLLPEMGYP